MLVVLCILAFNYLLALHPTLTLNVNLLEIFFNLFGILYAIIIGFAIYVVLNNYNEIKYYMSNEINELQDLRDYLMYVDGQEETKKGIKKNIKRYVESVIHQEWTAMSLGKEVDIDTPAELYDVMVAVNKIEPANASDNVALDKLIGSISAITTYRTNRLNASIEKLPPLLRHLILILSVFIVFTFTLIPIDNFWVNMGLNGLNSFGIALIYFVIIDLDYPFGGVWCITPKPFEDFLKKLASDQETQ